MMGWTKRDKILRIVIFVISIHMMNCYNLILFTDDTLLCMMIPAYRAVISMYHSLPSKIRVGARIGTCYLFVPILRNKWSLTYRTYSFFEFMSDYTISSKVVKRYSTLYQLIFKLEIYTAVRLTTKFACQFSKRVALRY
jgi:hypothetical protein